MASPIEVGFIDPQRQQHILLRIHTTNEGQSAWSVVHDQAVVAWGRLSEPFKKWKLTWTWRGITVAINDVELATIELFMPTMSAHAVLRLQPRTDVPLIVQTMRWQSESVAISDPNYVPTGLNDAGFNPLPTAQSDQNWWQDDAKDPIGHASVPVDQRGLWWWRNGNEQELRAAWETISDPVLKRAVWWYWRQEHPELMLPLPNDAELFAPPHWP